MNLFARDCFVLLSALLAGCCASLARASDETLFITPAQPSAEANVAVFEKRFCNRGEIKRATWTVTALGVFDVFANGVEVGAADVLKPGVTECGKCRHASVYDVTELLTRAAGGENVLLARVSPGWWCDAFQTKIPGIEPPWQLGREVAFRGELELVYSDGRTEVIRTGTDWKGAYAGPLRKAGIYEGEVYDARLAVGTLGAVKVNDEFAGEIRPAAAKVCRREDLTMKPVAVRILCGSTGGDGKDVFGTAVVRRRYADGDEIVLDKGETLLVDFGQNASAVPSFEVCGAAGTAVEIRHAEMLNDANGERSRGNDGPAGTPYLASLRKAYAGIRYTLKEGRQTYRPAHTFFGYRYLRVTATDRVTFRRFRSTPVTSVSRDLERGAIETGNADVNRLVSNARWGFYSNYLSIPTDCPQRDERFGWTADTQVFMESAAYLADTYDFLSKFMDDLADAQASDGLYPCFVPNSRFVFRHGASSGWTDAGVIVPYRLWKRYGKTDVIARHWDSMARYRNFTERTTNAYFLTHGDWLAYEHRNPKPELIFQPEEQRTLLTAYYTVMVDEMMAEMAAALGREADRVRFAASARRHREAFAATYLQADGTLPERFRGQCNDLYLLKLGLCPTPAATEATRQDLLANIRAHGNRLQTGFLGTAVLLPVLTFEARSPETAYDLLFQRENPSWLYSVDQGATTIWERWDGYTKEKGFGPKAMNSFNHYAYGCVLEWLFAAAAGIRQEATSVGYRRLLLQPFPDRRLGFVKAHYESPTGRIESAWRYGADGSWTWDFTIPAGATAMVLAPGETEGRAYGPGRYCIRK